MATVSVVVPVHNRAELMRATLDSVLNQSFHDWECIIVDDHSDDGSVDVAKVYENKDQRFRSASVPDSKRYANAARNYGLSLAQGKYVNFLDSDDLLARDKLQIQVAYLRQNPNVDMVTCRHIEFRAVPGDIQRQPKYAPQSQWLDVLWYAGRVSGGLWSSASPLWRREVIQKIGGWTDQIRDCASKWAGSAGCERRSGFRMKTRENSFSPS